MYLAIDFVDGPTLRDALGRGRRLSFADTLRVAWTCSMRSIMPTNSGSSTGM